MPDAIPPTPATPIEMEKIRTAYHTDLSNIAPFEKRTHIKKAGYFGALLIIAFAIVKLGFINKKFEDSDFLLLILFFLILIAGMIIEALALKSYNRGIARQSEMLLKKYLAELDYNIRCYEPYPPVSEKKDKKNSP